MNYNEGMKKITILIPAYNEEQVLPILKDRLMALADTLPKYALEFLFVNDGSRDNTMQIIRDWAETDQRVSYVNFTRNFGKEAGMIAGFDHIKSDATVIIDADLQDPPELIPDMIKLWEEGYEDVYAKRRSRDGETWVKKKTSEWYYKILQKSTRIPIQRDTGDFRLLSQRCIEALQQLRESERNTKALFSWIGYKKKEILYDRYPRAAGTTKWNYAKLIELALDGITSFTVAPLRIATLFGVLFSGIAFVYLAVIVVRALMGVAGLPGYSSMMAVILFLGGVQLLSLGIIGEYVGRIFKETKHRPLYLVDEYHDGYAKKK